jgi:ABC-2 type transport system ATP-binding protein
VPPVISVRDLGVRTRRGWVLRAVDLDVRPGDLVAVSGPAGSGRTSLLLALAGRFTTTRGSRTAAGTAALAYVPGAHEPEPALSVAEHVAERLALLGRAPLRPWRRRRMARTALARTTLDPQMLARDLDPLGRHRLCLLLALLAEPDAVMVDAVDDGLTAAEQRALWSVLRGIATGGTAVVAACREVDPDLPDRVHTLEIIR